MWVIDLIDLAIIGVAFRKHSISAYRRRVRGYVHKKYRGWVPQDAFDATFTLHKKDIF